MISLAQARPPFVEFKQVAVHDLARSLELGYRVTKDKDFAFIMQPGSRDVLEIEATSWLDQMRRKIIQGSHDAYPQAWMDQFQAKYDAFKAGQEAPVNGEHVRDWAELTPAQVQNFIALKIYAVEDVAVMTEEAMGRLGMGARALKEKAIKRLAQRELAGNAIQENAELKAQLAALSSRLAELEADKPKRGRPAKVELVA